MTDDNCERCAAPIEGNRCPACGLLKSTRGKLLASLPAIAVGTLLLTPLVAALPSFVRLGSSGSLTGGGFFELIGALASSVMSVAAGPILAALIGVAVAQHVYPRGWWSRLLAAALTVLVAFGLMAAGGSYGIVRFSIASSSALPPLAGCAIGSVAGALLAPRLEGATKRFAVLPSWLGAAKALLWVPLIGGVLGVATYVLAGVLVIAVGLFLLYIAGVVAWALLRGASGAERPSPAPILVESVQPAEGEPEAVEESRTRNHFDQHGSWLGRTDEEGNHFDMQGKWLGKTDEQGNRFDTQGKWLGKTDEQGNHFDPHGHWQGRSDEEGHRFDEHGKYLGRSKVS